MNLNTDDLALQRPTWAEVNLDALRSNYFEVQKIAPAASVMAVVKADAYGHGAFVIAKELQDAGVNFFATATSAEAVQLRRGGIRVPLLVLSGMTPEQLPLLQHFDFTPTAYNREFLNALADFATARRRFVTAHLKVDTGMGRLGFSEQEAAGILQDGKIGSYVRIDGIFTHLASAEIQEDEYTKEQLRQFAEFVRDCGSRISCAHAANSAAILNYSDSHFHLVRPGLLLYGISPMGKDPSFRPILSLKSKIIFLHTIRRGETIGYGRAFRAERDSLIATVPVGYSDGLRRSLSNKLHVEIRGKHCRIAGNVSMDLCMVDVTDIAHEVQLYDVVTLIGSGITAWDWAEQLDTIPYEITCLIGSRVPRVYYKNNQIIDVYYP